MNGGGLVSECRVGQTLVRPADCTHQDGFQMIPTGSASKSDRCAGLLYCLPEQTKAVVTFPATMVHCGGLGPAHLVQAWTNTRAASIISSGIHSKALSGTRRPGWSCLCGQRGNGGVLIPLAGPLLLLLCWEGLGPQVLPLTTI